jgi:hypothetical protein
MNSNDEYTALAVLVALAHECRDAVAAHPIGVEEWIMPTLRGMLIQRVRDRAPWYASR